MDNETPLELEKNTVKITFGFDDNTADATFIHNIEQIYTDHLMSLGKRANSYTFEAKTNDGELVKVVIANNKITAQIAK